MTEQEADEWAARLTRVWKIDGSRLKVELWLDFDGTTTYYFEGELKEGATFHQWEEGSLFRISSSELCTYIDNYRGDIYHWEYLSTPNVLRQSTPFTLKWLPFFRRSCWLSGCAIEATAHEKAEWMQGLSREEIEAWNLKV